MHSTQEWEGIRRARVRRALTFSKVRPGQLWWEKNGMDDKSGPVGSLVYIKTLFSIAYYEDGTPENVWTVIVLEQDGRIYEKQQYKMLITSDDVLELLAWP